VQRELQRRAHPHPDEETYATPGCWRRCSIWIWRRIRELLAETYAKKPQLVDSNMKAIQLGYDYARATFPCPLPLRVEPMTGTAGHIMIDGNTAAALGACSPGPPWLRGTRSRRPPR